MAMARVSSVDNCGMWKVSLAIADVAEVPGRSRRCLASFGRTGLLASVKPYCFLSLACFSWKCNTNLIKDWKKKWNMEDKLRYLCYHLEKKSEFKGVSGISSAGASTSTD